MKRELFQLHILFSWALQARKRQRGVQCGRRSGRYPEQGWPALRLPSPAPGKDSLLLAWDCFDSKFPIPSPDVGRPTPYI